MSGIASLNLMIKKSQRITRMVTKSQRKLAFIREPQPSPKGIASAMRGSPLDNSRSFVDKYSLS